MGVEKALLGLMLRATPQGPMEILENVGEAVKVWTKSSNVLKEGVVNSIQGQSICKFIRLYP
jgi:hypothetical protein